MGKGKFDVILNACQLQQSHISVQQSHLLITYLVFAYYIYALSFANIGIKQITCLNKLLFQLRHKIDACLNQAL